MCQILDCGGQKWEWAQGGQGSIPILASMHTKFRSFILSRSRREYTTFNCVFVLPPQQPINRFPAAPKADWHANVFADSSIFLKRFPNFLTFPRASLSFEVSYNFHEEPQKTTRSLWWWSQMTGCDASRTVLWNFHYLFRTCFSRPRPLAIKWNWQGEHQDNDGLTLIFPPAAASGKNGFTFPK